MEIFITFLLMIIVFFGCYLVTKSIAAGSLFKQKKGLIKIVDRQFIAQDKLLVVAKVGEKAFLIAFSGNSAQLIAPLDEKDAEAFSQETKSQEVNKFSSILSQILEKKDKDGESY